MKKGPKKVIKIVLAVILIPILLVVILAGVMVLKTVNASHNQVNAEIDMDKVADGVYLGSSDGGLVQVEVEVEVKDHKIVNINLLQHRCGKGQPAEVIIDDMVKYNTDDVDAVSGATASSKTIRNAVNQALQSGLK